MELYTPDGYFIRMDNKVNSGLYNKSVSPHRIAGLTLYDNTFIGCKVGIWLKKNGQCIICSNGV